MIVETVLATFKATTVIMLAEVALLPTGGVEEWLVRAAATITAVGIIWLKGIRPAGRWVERMRARIERFFDDHDDAIKMARETREDVKDIKDWQRIHLEEHARRQWTGPVISTEGQEPPR